MHSLQGIQCSCHKKSIFDQKESHAILSSYLHCAKAVRLKCSLDCSLSSSLGEDAFMHICSARTNKGHAHV